MRTCKECGETKPADEMVLRDGKPRPVCKVCHRRKVKAWRENAKPDQAAEFHRKARARADRYYENHRDAVLTRVTKRRLANVEEERHRTAEALRRIQSATRAVAERHYAIWTGWELELVADRTRSVKSLAFQLGRTHQAVANMRRKIGRDAKLAERAGLSESGRA